MTAPETANVEPEFVQAKPYKVELEPGKVSHFGTVATLWIMF